MFVSPNLRSKRFRRVGEQRKSEEHDFRRFTRAKNGALEKHRKTRSSFFLCSQTPLKRLLRRLCLSSGKQGTVARPGRALLTGNGRWANSSHTVRCLFERNALV